MDVAAEQRVHSFGGAVVRHVFEADTRGLSGQRDRILAGRTERGADDDLAGPLLGVGDQLLEGFPWRPGADGNDRGGRGDHANRIERLVIFQVDHAAEIDRVDIVVRAKKRVTVRRLPGRFAFAHRAGCAADIGDDDRLTEIFLQQRHQRPEDHVGVTTGRPGHDQLDGTIRIIGGNGVSRHRQQHSGGGQQLFR